MKTIRIIYFLFALLIFNVSCAQNYEWKKLGDGLYISVLNSSKGKLLNQNDSINIEMSMFHPNYEIDLKKPINGKPSSYKTIYSKLNKSFNYKRNLKFKKNSEYLVKKFNVKKIPNYSFKLNKISVKKMKEITNLIEKKYGLEFFQYISNINSEDENNISSLTIKPFKKIDIEIVKKEFENEILEITIQNTNLNIYIYKIKS